MEYWSVGVLGYWVNNIFKNLGVSVHHSITPLLRYHTYYGYWLIANHLKTFIRTYKSAQPLTPLVRQELMDPGIHLVLGFRINLKNFSVPWLHAAIKNNGWFKTDVVAQN